MFKSHAKDFKEKAMKQIQTNMHVLTKQYQHDLKTKLDVPPARSGRIYQNLKGKLFHVASAPGESPAPLTGALIESISAEEEEPKKRSLKTYVYSNQAYAISLELGNDHIKPRPAWKVVLDENKDEYADIVTAGFQRRVLGND